MCTNIMKKIIILAVIAVGIITIGSTMIISYASHVDESDPDIGCKKWVSISELAKQDYPHFLEDSLIMAERFCEFDISEFLN